MISTRIAGLSNRYMATKIAAGSVLPSVKVHEKTPSGIDIRDVFGKEKGILIGVPGAFTPNCHLTHIPSYIKDFEALKTAGVKNIACVAVNDVFVMNAWAENLKADGKVRMLADPKADLVKALGLDFSGAVDVLGNVRSKRFAAVID